MQLIDFVAFNDFQYLHVLPVVEAASEADLQRCLTFIPSEHPYFNAGNSEIADARGDILLQKVLHCCDAKELQL